MSPRLFRIGSYTGESGDGTGITTWSQDPGSGALTAFGTAVPTDNPTFLAANAAGDRLYAVGEGVDGVVTVFAVDDRGGLAPLGQPQSTGGSGPCHLIVDPSGRYVLVANYDSGSVGVHPIAADGSLRPRSDLVQHAGAGPDHDRQEQAHAHQVVADPTGRHLLAVDLGTDEIRTYRLDSDTGQLQPGPVGRAEPGAGPRHVAFHPDGRLLVADELGSTLSEFGYDASTAVLARRRSVAATVGAPAGRNYPAELVISENGKYAYLSNRGADCVTVFAVDTPSLRALVDVPCGGTWPRHITVDGQWLYVANQNSHTVATFRIDPDSGIPAPTGAVVDVPSPACVLAPID